MALIWLRLCELTGDKRLLNAALKAIDLVERAQYMDPRARDLHGAVPGSDPIWGGYIRLGLPNWSVKFFLDALLARRRVLDAIESLPSRRWKLPDDVPRHLPPRPAASVEREIRTVLYAGAGSDKAVAMLRAWKDRRLGSVSVVLVEAGDPPPLTRLLRAVEEEGLTAIPRRLRGRMTKQPGAAAGPGANLPDVSAFCEAEGIPLIRVRSLVDPADLERIRALQPDVAVHAGAGILRDEVLGIPRLGTLNAHMGLLPMYRGMNVSEWAALEGNPVGCTVHFIDPGIDTGPIIAVREVDSSAARSIAELREIVDRAQLALLGEVLERLAALAQRPPVRPQHPDEGRQFFRMHDDLRAILEARLEMPGTGE
jgi:folate-dependent phosphoribosylglycinamide formyltransferase PurN